MIGKLENKLLNAVLEAIPVEISVLDSNDKVVAWNKHQTRIFKRPEVVIGRDVRQCHPPKSLAKVEQILKEMKENKREMAEFWIDLPINKEPHKVYIRYFALRDENSNYLGCLEATMDVDKIQKLKGEKRLI